MQSHGKTSRRINQIVGYHDFIRYLWCYCSTLIRVLSSLGKQIQGAKCVGIRFRGGHLGQIWIVQFVSNWDLGATELPCRTDSTNHFFEESRLKEFLSVVKPRQDPFLLWCVFSLRNIFSAISNRSTQHFRISVQFCYSLYNAPLANFFYM